MYCSSGSKCKLHLQNKFRSYIIRASLRPNVLPRFFHSMGELLNQNNLSLFILYSSIVIQHHFLHRTMICSLVGPSLSADSNICRCSACGWGALRKPCQSWPEVGWVWEVFRGMGRVCATPGNCSYLIAVLHCSSPPWNSVSMGGPGMDPPWMLGAHGIYVLLKEANFVASVKMLRISKPSNLLKQFIVSKPCLFLLFPIAPESYEQLKYLLLDRTMEEQLLVIERIRKSNHASLAVGNKAKLEVCVL